MKFSRKASMLARIDPVAYKTISKRPRRRRATISVRRDANFRRTADGRSLISASDDYGGLHRLRSPRLRHGAWWGIKHNDEARACAKIMPAASQKDEQLYTRAKTSNMYT